MNYNGFESLKGEFPGLSLIEIQRIMKHRPEQSWKSDAQSLQEGMPWEYDCLEADFGPITLAIEPPLLIPRQDTWDWLEQSFAEIGPQHLVLDLGCGPGTLGLGWLSLQRSPFLLTAIDCNPTSIRVTSQNLRNSALSDWECYRSDWFDGIPQKRFDLILSNPPYCDIAHKSFIEPSIEDPGARFAPQGGLEPYLKIFSKAALYLMPQSHLIVEHGADQGLAIIRLGSVFKLKKVSSYHDQQGHWRATHFQLDFSI